MTSALGAPMALLALGALPLLPLIALAQPAPPDLSQLPPVVAAAPASASSAASAAGAPRKRCVAGCDGQSARITRSEDALNRFEEHRNERGELVQLFVMPKNGAPRYEVLVGAERSKSPLSRRALTQEPGAQQREGQAVWRVREF